VARYASSAEDLVLHGPRVLGFATAPRVAARFGLDPALTDDLLLDFEARGWVRHSAFAGSAGWSLTDSGQVENERRLSLELDRAGAREAVTAAHAAFVPLNRRFGAACTDWQLRSTPADRLAFNDHSDPSWDEAVVVTLASLERALGETCAALTRSLRRFDGYAERYSAALARARAGQPRWVDAPDVDSCHTVWIQLHEDLLATLGMPRGSDA
jgi:hypothetical protein